MAASALAERLTEAHRAAQIDVSKAVARDITALFPLWDPKRPATFDEYARMAKLAIAGRKAESADLALSYLTLYREAEEVPGRLPDGLRSAALDETAVATSLRVTGPVTAYQSLGQGRSIQDAMSRALTASIGSSIRHARAGDRETLYNALRRDPQAKAVRRVTDGKPCSFCALLATRTNYKSEESASFKAHDACGCTAEVLYRDPGGLTGQAKEWHDLYLDETTGSGAAARRSFRRAYESRYGA